MASNAASGAGSGFQNTFKNMKAAWDSEVRPEEPETTDEYIAALARGTKKVFTSDEVKKEIGSVASNTQKTLSEVGLAGSLFTKKINAELSSSEKWNSSVTELQANLKILAAVITVGTIKLVESSRGRELPPTK